jgi:hypothetical protein
MKAPVSTTSENVRFACGVFRNNKLVAVRPDRVAPVIIQGKADSRIIFSPSTIQSRMFL